jgi:hypothetical protein
MSTHRERFLKKHGLPNDISLSIPEISNLSGVPVAALRQVYSRGMGAAHSNLQSVRLLKDFSKNPDTKRYPASARLSPQQWGIARIFSFVQHGPTYKTADADIARKFNL